MYQSEKFMILFKPTPVAGRIPSVEQRQKLLEDVDPPVNFPQNAFL